MTTETYSGWTNRETWVANLWITNDQGSLEMATEAVRNAEDNLRSQADALGDFLDDVLKHSEGTAQTPPDGRQSDTIGGAIGSTSRSTHK